MLPPAYSRPDGSVSLIRTDTASHNAAKTTRLDALPIELLDQILAELGHDDNSSVNDYFAIGYALPTLWPAALRHARYLKAKNTLGLWAGVPVIGVGDLQGETDDPEHEYPPCLSLSAADLDEMRDGIDPSEAAPRHYIREGSAATLYDVARWRYNFARGYWALGGSISAGGALGEEFRIWFERMYKALAQQQQQPQRGHDAYYAMPLTDTFWLLRADSRYKTMEESLRALLQQQNQRWRSQLHWSSISRSRNNDFYPADEPWLLRNLTTREYVRAEPLARLPGDVRGPFMDGLSIRFGDVVALRTRFHGYRTLGLERISPHEGLWAGHRFDITTLARHRREQRQEEDSGLWTDVSDEVAREMKRLWTSRFRHPYHHRISVASLLC